jgi:hypothetical protein
MNWLVDELEKKRKFIGCFMLLNGASEVYAVPKIRSELRSAVLPTPHPFGAAKYPMIKFPSGKNT